MAKPYWDEVIQSAYCKNYTSGSKYYGPRMKQLL